MQKKKTGTKRKRPGGPALKTAQQKLKQPPKKRIDPYATPEFTQRLIDHMHRAKIAALRDAQG